MITGRAVTNVFDGDKLLGDAADPEAFRLKGVERHFHVGFLTLLEVLRYAKVGMHYKAPLHPIWVIGSDSHYTVAFGDRACIGRLSAAEAATHAAKVVFQQLDPEENGFISADRLADLQRQLSALQNVPIAQLRRELDDGGIVMWERIKTFLLVRLALGFGLDFHLDERVSFHIQSALFHRVLHVSSQNPPAPAQSAALAALPAVAWSCGACTFQNGPHASVCEICESARPLQATVPAVAPAASGAGAAPAAAAAEESPEHFQIFHFNGIGMQVRRISVVQVDANMAEV
jgi:hypothetical protein